MAWLRVVLFKDWREALEFDMGVGLSEDFEQGGGVKRKLVVRVLGFKQMIVKG